MHISYGVIPIYIDEQKQKNYLILQSNGGFWGFPKGHAEGDETPQQAALREAKEEANLDIDPSELDFSVDYSYEQPIDGTMQTKTIVLFPIIIQKQEVNLQASEIKAHKWATLHEAIELINLPSVAEPLSRVESHQF